MLMSRQKLCLGKPLSLLEAQTIIPFLDSIPSGKLCIQSVFFFRVGTSISMILYANIITIRGNSAAWVFKLKNINLCVDIVF